MMDVLLLKFILVFINAGSILHVYICNKLYYTYKYILHLYNLTFKFA